MKKRIYITESQLERLLTNKQLIKEYLDSSFDWHLFDNLESLEEKYDYCYEKLGKPIGEGTARAVFEVDDYSVLKLFTGGDNHQNKVEFETVQKLKDNPLLPKIYGHDEDFVWLWTEKVIPAVAEDFEKILGVPFGDTGWNFKFDKPRAFNGEYNVKDEDALLVEPIENPEEGRREEISFENFVEWFGDYRNDLLFDWSEQETRVYTSWFRNPWIQDLIEIMEYQPLAELCPENFGIALRNGKPTLVVLDIGWLN